MLPTRARRRAEPTSPREAGRVPWPPDALDARLFRGLRWECPHSGPVGVEQAQYDLCRK
jgi:hypothetical protein